MHETRQRNAELALINSVQEAIAGELDAQAIYDARRRQDPARFSTRRSSISRIVDEATGLMHYPYFDRARRTPQAEPRPVDRLPQHVIETREPLLIDENIVERGRESTATARGGRRVAKSVIFVPLVAGGKATGVISLQNLDREHAFDDADQRLLTTLAGSLSVALENARLVDETRQRVAELATVNSVGQALASQLDLDALIELVGERVRETFDADIAYVALHDEAAGRIDFAYYYESRRAPARAADRTARGSPRRSSQSREPLLLNREEQLRGATPRSARLPAPTSACRSSSASKAIGVISVQSIEEEGRFGEAESRLLATIAANVGVAIQNARLFAEIGGRSSTSSRSSRSVPAAVVVMDADERVTGWNPAAAELFGYSAEEAIGHPIDELVFARGPTAARAARVTRGGARDRPRAADHPRAGARTARRSTSS